MRISQLAERCGVPATTLRFYESAGLLTADRTAAGYRVYGPDAVERLAFIGAAKHLGLPLEEVGELLRVWEAGRCDPECGFLGTSSGTDGAETGVAERWRTAAVACSLSAQDVGERTAQWHDVLGAVVERVEIPEGLRLTLPAERAAEVAALAAAEQRCCPFFDFCIHLDGRMTHLEVRAPAEGAALLGELFGPPA